MTTSQQIKVRACSIMCVDHPEWGTFGVMEDNGGNFTIANSRGSRMLDKWEADNFWQIMPATSNYVCPVCGPQEKSCSEYAKELNEATAAEGSAQ